MTQIQEFESRIEHMTTQWSLVHDAAIGSESAAGDARQQILARYARPIYRYLYAAVKDLDTADDLAQEFALRCLRGDLTRVERGNGRFRDYLKAVLRNIVNDYFRQNQSRSKLEEALRQQQLDETDTHEADDVFVKEWRSELLQRAWKRLSQDEVQGNNPGYYTVLRLKSEQPSMSSEELAECASQRLERIVSPVAVRQLLSRSRKAFAGTLLSEIRESIETDDAEDIDMELIELDLYRYCRNF